MCKQYTISRSLSGIENLRPTCTVGKLRTLMRLRPGDRPSGSLLAFSAHGHRRHLMPNGQLQIQAVHHTKVGRAGEWGRTGSCRCSLALGKPALVSCPARATLWQHLPSCTSLLSPVLWLGSLTSGDLKGNFKPCTAVCSPQPVVFHWKVSEGQNLGVISRTPFKTKRRPIRVDSFCRSKSQGGLSSAH